MKITQIKDSFGGASGAHGCIIPEIHKFLGNNQKKTVDGMQNRFWQAWG